MASEIADHDFPVTYRFVSLDVFRGLTIAGMIVVNTPGTWEHVFSPLLHAEWNGWTYTDTIFPFFLFIVGVSMAFSFARRSAQGEKGALLAHTARRAVVIFLLGLGLNCLSFLLFHRQHVRIPGVLQRIAVCFFIAALLFVLGGKRAIVPAGLVLLFGYWALMTLVPVPGLGAGRLDVEGSLAAYVDRAVLGSHTWKHDPGWDPEGLLSTLPAIATTLMGLLAGLLLRSAEPLEKKVLRLLLWGWLGVLAGLLWNLVLPINKNLWTSSYAVFMSGLACACLGVCVFVFDARPWQRWAAPFRWLGMNAIALFIASDVATILLLWIKVTDAAGKRRSLYNWTFKTLFDHFADPRIGSLLFALSFCAVWIAVGGVLYRRRIFLKV